MSNKMDSVDKTFLVFIGIVTSLTILALIVINTKESIKSYNNRQIECTYIENGFVKVNGEWVKPNATNQ